MFGLTKPLVLANPTVTGVDALYALDKVWTYDEKNTGQKYACISVIDWSLFTGESFKKMIPSFLFNQILNKKWVLKFLFKYF